jgi:hypothetical protein
MSTLTSERNAFLRRLRSDPAFLLKHVPALSFAVFRKIKNKLTIALSSTHQGRKIKPDWLLTDTLINVSPRTATALDITTLPIYPCGSRVRANKSVRNVSAGTADDDMEDHLAGNRWGFLMFSLLNDCVDRRSDFDECIRWIASHSEKTDRMWEPYSACERVANLLIYLAAMPLAMRVEAIPRQLAEFLDDSLKWIYQHLEYYGASETNNHILNNARVLVLAGVARRNGAAISAGMTIFRNCLPNLILGGGFLRERSSHYQLIVLNWMLDSWRFIVASEGKESEDARFLYACISRMLSAASMICGLEGLLGMIGDVSPDATPEHTVARLALLYPEFWPASGESRNPVEVKDGWFRISIAQEVILGNFPTGYYPPKFPTHGHSDLTSFVWLHGGREILGDSGRCRYTPDAVSQYQRSAIGHNLPTVNGFAPLCETLVANGAWWPLPFAKAELESIECELGIVLAHDGFARATPATRHVRRIVVQERTLLVSDSFEGRGIVNLGFCWHFGEDLDRFDAEHMVANGKCTAVRIQFDGAVERPIVEPIFGAMPGGWASDCYGCRRPALGIRFCFTVNLPAAISTLFLVTAEGAN